MMFKWRVLSVKPLDNYKLLLEFKDGKKAIYDMSDLINSHKPYNELKNIDIFNKVYVSGSSIAWSDLIDIAPEELYENSIEI